MARRWRVALLAAALAVVLGVCTLAANGAPVARRYFTEARTQQSVSDPFIQDAAKFAVDELKLLSDSGVYTTLSLNEVLDASTQIGDFHYVTHLRVLLASPHFASRKPLETFEMMVLERKAAPPETATTSGSDAQDAEYSPRSIAIDEFPVMDEAAIEQFWIRKVEDRRRRRRELFAQWEADENGSSDTKKEDKKRTLLSLEQLEGMPTSELRKFLTNRASSEELRVAVTRIIDDRLDRLQRLERGASGVQGINTARRDEL